MSVRDFFRRNCCSEAIAIRTSWIVMNSWATYTILEPVLLKFSEFLLTRPKRYRQIWVSHFYRIHPLSVRYLLVNFSWGCKWTNISSYLRLYHVFVFNTWTLIWSLRESSSWTFRRSSAKFHKNSEQILVVTSIESSVDVLWVLLKILSEKYCMISCWDFFSGYRFFGIRSVASILIKFCLRFQWNFSKYSERFVFSNFLEIGSESFSAVQILLRILNFYFHLTRIRWIQLRRMRFTKK